MATDVVRTIARLGTTVEIYTPEQGSRNEFGQSSEQWRGPREGMATSHYEGDGLVFQFPSEQAPDVDDAISDGPDWFRVTSVRDYPSHSTASVTPVDDPRR